jgi:hypothetical protein
MFLEKPMVALVVKKFLTAVRELSTMHFEILIHLDPIYSTLIEAAFFPTICHPTALHCAQTQTVTMRRSPLRSSLFWDVTQHRFIVIDISGQSVLTSRAKQSEKSFVFL